MNIEPADRLRKLPPYLFAEIARKRAAAVSAGRDVIDFGVGDPDQPTPQFIIDRMRQAVGKPENHCYPPGAGTPGFKRQVAAWFIKRFGVELNNDEILVLIGSKEGLGHLPLAVMNPGQTSIIFQPAYPVYESATIFAGGKPHLIGLSEANNWLPDFNAIDPQTAREARLMFINYPNNPTAATADLQVFEQAVAFARKHGIILVQDAAYTELAFDFRPPSILQVPGAKDVAVELHSLSKTFNMTGWRLGFAVGNAKVLAALAHIKNNMDSGQFAAVQEAGAEALAHADHPDVLARIDMYRERRDRAIEGLRSMGIRVASPQATFYVWAACPPGYDSMTFAGRILEEADVVVVPGVGFGAAGEGYFRLALNVDVKRIVQAFDRMSRVRF